MKNKVVMQMVGADGNAFAILGRFAGAARTAGWTPAEIAEVRDEAIAGDYSHLLSTIMANVEEPEEDDDNRDDIKCLNCHNIWCECDICDECEFCPDCCECYLDNDEDEE